MNQQTTAPITLRQLLPKHKKKRKKQDAPLGDNLSITPINPCQSEEAIWRAVILQAITDALSNSHKPSAKRHRKEARDWLNGFSSDFCTVCEYAGFDPHYIYEHIQPLLEPPQTKNPTSRAQHPPPNNATTPQKLTISMRYNDNTPPSKGFQSNIPSPEYCC